MNFIAQAADLYYTFRFLRLLVTPWTETDAYQLKVIDAEGKLLKPLSEMTPAQKSSYSMFVRLVFNVKRLIEKVPGGKSRLSSYIAGLWLIHEETGMSDFGIRRVMMNAEAVDCEEEIRESHWFLSKEGNLQPGTYTLAKNAPIVSTGECLALKGTRIVVEEATPPKGYFLGVPVFYLNHFETRQTIAVSLEDLLR